MKNDNEFPRNIFPKEVRDYIESYSDSQGLCKNFMYSSYLALASVMIGNNYQIGNESWKEPAILWIALVGRSGIKKTPVIKAILKPLEDLQSNNFKKYYEALKGNPNTFKPSQKIIDDVTMEALLEILDKNPHGLLLKKDELLTLIYDGERYSKSSGAIEKLLSIYSLSSISVNRKTNSQMIYIPRPFVSIIGGIQPKVTSELFAKNRGDNGFIARILFTTIGHYVPSPPKNNFNYDFYNFYEDFIRRFETVKNEEPILVPLSSEAIKFYNDWLASFIYEYESNDKLAEYKSKLEATAKRLALIIEVSYGVSTRKDIVEISLTAIENGIRLCDYFYATFKEILLLSNPPSAPENIQLNVKNKAIELFKKGLIQKEVVLELLKEGFKQVEISRYLEIPRTTISSYR
jgi:hypothetical protein